MHESMEALMKESELRILQSQINPHFLFNTLNSIVSLTRIEPEMARHITMQLSTFMRLNIRIIASHKITIQQEMMHLNSYLEIIQIRFKDQINMEVQFDPDLPMYMIPPVTLQPLVENCINHGLKDSNHGGRIRIEVLNKDDALRISVEDNGRGISPELLEKLGKVPVHSKEGNGIGVYNVNQRLIGLFGEESQLFIENKSDSGCKFTFNIPRISTEREE